MSKLINTVFEILITLSILITIVVGIAWLFDSKPDNLYSFWKFLGGCLVISLLFIILFGEKIKK